MLALAGAANAGLGLGCKVPSRAATEAPVHLHEAADGEHGNALGGATIAELRARLDGGTLTSRALTERCLARIDALDRRGPTLRSILEVNPDALQIARALDRELRHKGPRGPLHGIPIVLKDNIDTGDRMTTTAGALALEGSRARTDAALVTRLRDAGAVILAKANMSEWAYFRSDRVPSGWSGRGGLTRNPYALERNACGSSTGTAVAVAAELAVVGVGTETNGSIVCPAGVTALVGLKPTVGLVSRSGVIPIAHSFDTAGPLGRTVEDAAVVLTVLSAVDPRDPATASPGRPTAIDYSKFLERDGLRGARIGVVRAHVTGYSLPTDRVFERAIEDLRAQGAIVVDPADIPNLERLDGDGLQVMLYEFKAGIDAYLGQLGPHSRVHSLADVIAFNRSHDRLAMRRWGQELLERAQRKGPLTDPDYQRTLARVRRLAGEHGIDHVLAQHRLDALVAPTGGPAWVIDMINGDNFLGSSASASAYAGYPVVTVPAGEVEGLPVGLSFIGPAWSEPVLIKLAYAYEQATHHRRAPTFAAAIGNR